MAATSSFHSVQSFSLQSLYRKGSRLATDTEMTTWSKYLLFLPVNEVPVVCEDGSASFPELQEDCCWKT